MKTIGLIAGIGPESTVDYYKRIIDSFRGTEGELHVPEIIIYSADLHELMAIMEAGDRERLTDWLVNKIKSLHAAGADFAAIASNTPHVVYDEVKALSPLPLISIVEETFSKALSLGLKKTGLIGTRFTMRSGFFEQVFSNGGIPVIVPDVDDQEIIHHRLFTEIELGIIKDSTRSELLSIIKKMIEVHSIDSVILGCTELPLILHKEEFGVPFLDTTGIHVDSIVRYCIGA